MRKEHRVFRQISRGPIFAGVPILLFFGLIAAIAFGFFVFKMMLGMKVAIIWVIVVLLTWGGFAFVFAQDPAFLSLVTLRLMFIFFKVRTFERIASMCPGTQKLFLK